MVKAGCLVDVLILGNGKVRIKLQIIIIFVYSLASLTGLAKFALSRHQPNACMSLVVVPLVVLRYISTIK